MKYIVVLLAALCGSALGLDDDCGCGLFPPVCGSDGITYGSQCLLECIARNKPGLTMVREGLCSHSQPEHLNLVSQPVCICNKMLLPVCGSDGVTYSNPCLLGCAQKSNPGLAMVRYGTCQNNQVEELSSCPPMCPAIWAPVCGSDGVTYPSMCQFNCKQSQNSGLSVVHHGACEPVVEELSSCPPMCPLIWAPVCGSDGVTYPSMCQFNCKQSQNSGLKVVYYGACEAVKPRMVEAPVCRCNKMLLPVCGSDGVTYSNPCLLACAQESNPGLEMVRYGICLNEPEKPRFDEAPVCRCNKMMLPVCGSDGVTYSNPCLLACAQKYNPGLEMVRYGICLNNLP